MSVPSYYDHNEQSGYTDFTDTSWDEKFTLDFTVPAAGTYLIFVSTIVSGDSTSMQIFVRAQLDDTTTIMEGTHNVNDNNQTYDARSYSTVYKTSLSSGSHYIDIDAYISSSSYEGRLAYTKIAVIRLDDWLSSDEFKYEETDSEYTPASGSTWYTLETLTFTPDEQADFLIIGSVEMKTASTTVSSTVRLNYDSGSEMIPVDNTEELGENYVNFESRDTGDYYPFTWATIVNIPASSKTITMQAMWFTTNGRARRRRIIAIKLSAIAGMESTEDPSSTFTSAQWSDKSTLTFTPDASLDYMIIGGLIVKPDSSLYFGRGRLVHTAGTSPADINNSGINSKDADNPADCIPVWTAQIKTLGATSQTFKTQYGWNTIISWHYSKCSFIIAFPVEPEIVPAFHLKKLNRLLNGNMTNGLN